MKREIKFRAWEKNTKKMYDRVLASNGDPCSIVWDCDRKDWLNFDECSGYIMQYTGLKDKNGTGIYEGDIVIAVLSTGEIIFEDGCFIVKWLKDEDFFNNVLSRHANCITIVGNIYETPLLV